MPAVAVVTLVATALILLVVAATLIRTLFHLRHTSATLGAVLDRVKVITERTDTVPARLTSVNANLEPVRKWTETV
jgi:uncharacterized protein YoxC